MAKRLSTACSLSLSNGQTTCDKLDQLVDENKNGYMKNGIKENKTHAHVLLLFLLRAKYTRCQLKFNEVLPNSKDSDK